MRPIASTIGRTVSGKAGAYARIISVNAHAFAIPYAERLSRDATRKVPIFERIIVVGPNAVRPRSNATARAPSTRSPRTATRIGTQAGIHPSAANAIQ